MYSGKSFRGQIFKMVIGFPAVFTVENVKRNQVANVVHSQMCTVPYINAEKSAFPQSPFLFYNDLFFSTRVTVSPFTKRYIVNRRAVDG